MIETKKKSEGLLPAAVCSGIYLLLSLVNLVPLSALYQSLESDVMISDTLWPLAVYVLMQALDLTAVGVFLGTLLFFLHRKDRRAFFTVSFFHAATVLARYAITPITPLAFSEPIDYGADVIWRLVLALTAEMGFFGIAELLLRLGTAKCREYPAMPALFAGIWETVFCVFSRILFDVNYGAPESGLEVLSMVLGYASDLLAGAFLAGVIFLTAHCLSIKRNQDKEE